MPIKYRMISLFNSNRPFWPLCPVINDINIYQHGKQCGYINVKMYIEIKTKSDTYFMIITTIFGFYYSKTLVLLI